MSRSGQTPADGETEGRTPRPGDQRIDDLATRALGVVASRTAQTRPVTLKPVLVARLLEAAMGRSSEGYRDVAHHMLTLGISPEAIVDHYIPATARLMGEEWTSDESSFAQVTLGSSRLQALLREIGSAWRGADETPDARPSAIVMVPHGAQHTLGAAVLATQLRRYGLSVKLAIGVDGPGAADEMAGDGFDAVLISASKGDNVDTVRQIVQSARNRDGHSANRIVIGGTILDGPGDILALTGANYATSDLNEALKFCSIVPV